MKVFSLTLLACTSVATGAALRNEREVEREALFLLSTKALRNLIGKNSVDLLKEREQAVVSALITKYHCTGEARDLMDVLKEIEAKNESDGVDLEEDCKQAVIDLATKKTSAKDSHVANKEQAQPKAQATYDSSTAAALKKFNSVKEHHTSIVATQQEVVNAKTQSYKEAEAEYNTIEAEYSKNKKYLEGEIDATNNNFDGQVKRMKTNSDKSVKRSKDGAILEEKAAMEAKLKSTTLCTTEHTNGSNQIDSDIAILTPLEPKVNSYKKCQDNGDHVNANGEDVVCKDVRQTILNTVSGLQTQWGSTCLLEATLSQDSIPLNSLCAPHKKDNIQLLKETFDTCNVVAIDNFQSTKAAIWKSHETVVSDWDVRLAEVIEDRNKEIAKYNEDIQKAFEPTKEPKKVMEQKYGEQDDADDLFKRIKKDEESAVAAAKLVMVKEHNAAVKQKTIDIQTYHQHADNAWTKAQSDHSQDMSSNDQKCMDNRTHLKDELSTVNQIREKVARLRIVSALTVGGDSASIQTKN